MISVKSAMSGAAVAVTLMCSAMAPAVAQPPADLQNPQLDIVYLEPRNAAYRPIAERLKQRRVLEQLKVFLAPLKLPRKLVVNVDECGALTRPYKAQGPVTICYELVDEIEKVAAKADAPNPHPLLLQPFIQLSFLQL